MSTTGAAAGDLLVADGVAAAAVVGASGEGAEGTVPEAGLAAGGAISVIGSTPSGEGQPVVLFIDAVRDPLEIAGADDPLLVQAGESWIGRSASEVV
ncbi:MAG TPA: hypothetical protein VK801_02690 [Caulobacteraceae bacterium]|nr:hypothetical protein [Caulobacteraceae bacterium]